MTATNREIDIMQLRTRRASAAVAGALAAVHLAAVPIAAQGPPGAMPPSPVVAFELIQEEVVAGQTFVGTIMPLKRATIGSAVAGRVIEFPRKAGERVASGEKLARLLTQTIELETAAAEQELKFREAQLDELNNGTRPEELEQRRAERDGAAARETFLSARRARLDRARNSGPGAITDDQYEEARSAEIEAHEVYLSASAAYELAKAGPRKELIAQAAAQVAMQKAVVERLHDQITKHTMISRFDGYVVAEFTEEGAWVNAGDPVAEVAALDEVDVEVQVVEQAVPFVRIGEVVRVDIPSLPERIFEGTVAQVVPQADVRSRTFPVKIRVKNEITRDGPLLKAGMYARAALPAGVRQQAILVPKDAIVLGGGAPMMYVIQQGAPAGPGAAPAAEAGPSATTVVPVPVQLGVSRGPLIQVIGEIRPGQLVVIQGNERLRPGQPVSVAQIAKGYAE
ncbi:MAG: efflux RND transporter periplasmic adaptor subunit [Pirellulales bacterium]|nr:efflux RND transporter periplasmic adaptor subunit [Pirellulales bacterium]